MSVAWTPGPWEIAEDDRNGQAVVRGEHTEVATCWHHCVGSLEKQMRANANLIAAAPCLYEALEDFDNWFCGFDPEDQASRMEGRKIIIRARAALAKAKFGESAA